MVLKSDAGHSRRGQGALLRRFMEKDGFGYGPYDLRGSTGLFGAGKGAAQSGMGWSGCIGLKESCLSSRSYVQTLSI